MTVANYNLSDEFLKGDLVDSNLLLDDGAGINITATGVTQVDSSDASIDLGADPNNNVIVKAYLQWSAMDATTGDETYVWEIEESTDSGFSQIDKTTKRTLDRDESTGKIGMTFRPQHRYLRYTLTLGGTTPIIKLGTGTVGETGGFLTVAR